MIGSYFSIAKDVKSFKLHQFFISVIWFLGGLGNRGD